MRDAKQRRSRGLNTLQRTRHLHHPNHQVGAHDSTAWREEVLPFHEFVRRHMMTDVPPPKDNPLAIGVRLTHPPTNRPRVGPTCFRSA